MKNFYIMSLSMSIYIYLPHMYVHIYLYIDIHMYTYIDICRYMCVYVHMYIFIHKKGSNQRSLLGFCNYGVIFNRVDRVSRTKDLVRGNFPWSRLMSLPSNTLDPSLPFGIPALQNDVVFHLFTSFLLPLFSFLTSLIEFS